MAHCGSSSKPRPRAPRAALREKMPCSGMNSLVPSYYLVKSFTLNQLITSQCQDKPVAAMLNMVGRVAPV